MRMLGRDLPIEPVPPPVSGLLAIGEEHVLAAAAIE